LSLPQKFLWIS